MTDPRLSWIPAAGTDEKVDARDAALLALYTNIHLSVSDEERRLLAGIIEANSRGQSLADAFASAVVVNLDDLKINSDEFWEPETVTNFMGLLIDLNNREMLSGATLAVGPSGCGKTVGFIRTFEAKEMPYLVVHVPTITDPEKWLGHKEINDEGTRFVLSDLMTHIQKPGATILDEINRAHPAILNVIFSLLDDQRKIQIPELQGERGEPFYIYRHPQHMIAATANIGGGYGGTYMMDVALLERFPFRVPRDFPPEAEETKLLQARTGIPKEMAKTLAWVAAKSRALWIQEKLSRPISTRTLLHWATLIAAGMPITRAAEFSVLGQYRDEMAESSDIQQIKAMIEGKTG